MRLNFVFLLLLHVLCALHVGVAWSNEIIIKNSKIEEVMLTKKFYYTEHTYEVNSSLVKDLNEEKLSLDTPEGRLLQINLKMTRGDFDGWLSTWDDASKLDLKKIERKKFLDGWKAIYLPAAEIQLIKRADTSDFISILYLIIMPGRNPVEMKTVFVRGENGDIIQTNKYAEDPVFLGWTTSDKKITNF